MRLKFASLVVVALGAVGCGGGGGPGSDVISELDRANLGTKAEARAFSQISPVSIYLMAQTVVQFPELGDEPPPECPSFTFDGDRTHIVGGCTNEFGVRYEGEMEFVASSAGRPYGTLSFKNFGSTEQEDCGATGEQASATLQIDGTVELKGNADASDLNINLAVTDDQVEEGTCLVTEQKLGYAYKGKITGSVPDFSAISNEEDFANLTASTWNGKGQLGIAPLGFVDIETVDQVMDLGGCATGAMSGTSRLTGEKKVELTFRGAEECGLSATWTLDGVEQGELEGVTCSAMGGGSLSAFGLLALGGLLLRRRRDAH